MQLKYFSGTRTSLNAYQIRANLEKFGCQGEMITYVFFAPDASNTNKDKT